ncbi:SDR family oxidoreductase [Rhizobium laguerreae]|uniref:SDR family NAD(P)-dependent oxidoreductase n=1 Tax=Rhizobium laguerreae TaxID=1076926 RepID=UPI001C90ECD2|nr:SDR family oxidoreductase [Rhizobium laguerreae]MBY3101249.1 SDR family oxidoreductase [Rhizobium laguerreae]
MNNWASYPSLKNRVVLITGGGSGIGAEHVIQFCRQGARVGFIDYNSKVSNALVERLASVCAHAPEFLQADLRDVGQVETVIAEFAERVGDVEVLLNNAAHDERHRLEDVTPEYFDERIAFNLRHLVFCAKAVAPGMKRRGGGSIINFGSFSWRIGSAGLPIYLTAKAGIEGLTKGLARDLGADGIRVNCVVPGWIMTGRQLELWMDEEVKKRIIDMQCLKDLVQPSDVSRMALWLASDDSRMCTSQFFVVDGGWS